MNTLNLGLRRGLQSLLVLALLVLCLLRIPDLEVSRFIGSRFPWPDDRSLKWAALIVEGTLIQMILCLPVAALLACFLRRASWAVAVALAMLYCARAFHEVAAAASIRGFFGPAFSAYVIVTHCVLLVGGTLAMRNLRDRRALAHGKETQRPAGATS